MVAAAAGDVGHCERGGEGKRGMGEDAACIVKPLQPPPQTIPTSHLCPISPGTPEELMNYGYLKGNVYPFPLTSTFSTYLIN